MENFNKSPYELFGWECERGWDKLIIPVVEYINKWNTEHPKEEDTIYIDQIKEKFGTLRIYVSNAPEELYDMIDEVERRSYNVCEKCGSEENVGMVLTGWYRTICKSCVKDCIEHPEKEGVQYSNPAGIRWRQNADGIVFLVKKDGMFKEQGVNKGGSNGN